MKKSVMNASWLNHPRLYKFVTFHWVKRKLLIEIISSLLIILFVYAALSKLLDYEKFKFQLGGSPFVTKYSTLIAWLLPSIELIVSVLLLIKSTRLWGLFGSFFLMLLFTGYIHIMLNYSSYLPCSCGGIISNMSWGQHLIFNIFFTFFSLIGIIIATINTQTSPNK